jgi:hypothetical protein
MVSIQTKLAGDDAEIYLLQWLVAAEKDLKSGGPVSASLPLHLRKL